MLEVEVENFQSIAKAFLRIDGFTALVGRSNLGKSALVRAVKYALTGALGSDFVRHGATCARMHRKAKSCDCSTKVTLRGDGLQIVWEKGDSVNQYTITRDGVEQRYNALDRGEPEFLKPEFQQVPVGTERLLLQVADQFEPIFLLNKSGGVVADVLSDVANLDDANEAIKLVNRDRKEATSTRTVREKDLQVLKSSLGSFEGLDEAAGKALAVEAKFTAASELRQASVDLRRFVLEQETLEADQSALVLATAPGLPDWDASVTAAKQCFELDRMVRESTEKVAARDKLAEALTPVLSDWATVASAASTHADLHRFCLEASEKASLVKRLTGIDQTKLPDMEGLKGPLEKITQIEGWLKQLRGLKEVLTRLQNIAAVPEVVVPSFSDKAQAVSQVRRWERAYEAAESSVAATVEELEAAQEEEAAVVAEFEKLGVCPTCEQGLGRDHVHKGA